MVKKSERTPILHSLELRVNEIRAIAWGKRFGMADLWNIESCSKAFRKACEGDLF